MNFDRQIEPMPDIAKTETDGKIAAAPEKEAAGKERELGQKINRNHQT